MAMEVLEGVFSKCRQGQLLGEHVGIEDVTPCVLGQELAGDAVRVSSIGTVLVCFQLWL